MQLNHEARRHWIEVFERAMDGSTDHEFVRLSQRLELFNERLDEREQSEDGTCDDDDTPFDFGSGY